MECRARGYWSGRMALCDMSVSLLITAICLAAVCAYMVIPRWIHAPLMSKLISSNLSYSIGQEIYWNDEYNRLSFIANRRIPPTEVEGSLLVQFSDYNAILTGAGYVNGRTSRHLPQMVVDNGVVGPTFSEIFYLRQSPNGQRIAYVARIGDQLMMMIDQSPSQPYYTLTECVFSTDSQHYYYTAQQDGQMHFIVDGKTIAKGDMYNCGMPEQGTHTSWMLRHDEDRSLFIDGQLIENCKPTPDSPLIWSSTGEHWACIALTAHGQAVINHGVTGESVEFIQPETLSWNSIGTQLAYWAVKNGQLYAIIGSDQYGPYDDRAGGFTWSTDGMHVSFVAKRKQNWVAIVDGKECIEKSDRLSVYFIGQNNELAFSYLDSEGESLLMPNGTKYSLPDACSPQFSPDGHHVIAVTRIEHDPRQYLLSGGQHHTLWIDGRKIRTWDYIGSMSFSGDGQSIVFIAIAGGNVVRVELPL